MSKINASDITKTELSKEEAIKLMGEDIAPQSDEYGNRSFRGTVKLNLRFKGHKTTDTLQAIVFLSQEMLEDQPKRFIDLYLDKMLIKSLEDQLTHPHPSYGKILSYKVAK